MEIRNADDLKKYLEKIAHQANLEVANKVVDDVKDSIDKVVYRSYNPNNMVYERTYELRDSVAITNQSVAGSRSIVEVSHDTKKLNYQAISGKLDNAGVVPDIIIKGQAGAITEKGYWSASSKMQPHHTFALPRDYITPVQDTLMVTYGDMFKEILRKNTDRKVL